MNSLSSKNSGFTLIEVIVVAAITVMMTLSLIANFSKSSTDLVQTANKLVADIRDAQTRAVAGAQFAGSSRCGYGIHYIDPATYVIYAGPASTDPLIDCSTQNRNYDANLDVVVVTKRLGGTSIVMAQSFQDVFFEPPNPTTYINNAVIPAASQAISLVKKGGSCPSDCKITYIYGTGRIETK